MDYRYDIHLLDGDGHLLARRRLQPDWNLLLEGVHFAGVRRGKLPALQVSGASLRRWRITPTWQAAGAPWVDGLRVELWAESHAARWGEASDDCAWSELVPRRFFAPWAEAAAAAVLPPGERLRYLVAATPVAAAVEVAPSPPRDDDFALAEVVAPLPLTAAALTSERRGGDADWFPLAFAPSVLDQLQAAAEAERDRESGGFLIGELHRDIGSPAIFARVNAHLPARHTAAAADRLSFTPDTWAALADDLAACGPGALVLGWWHSHPDFCRLSACPPARRSDCERTRPFLSADDVLLHRTCFGRPYHVALLLSDAGQGWTAACFGWRHGGVAARPFCRISGPAPVAGRAADYLEDSCPAPAR